MNQIFNIYANYSKTSPNSYSTKACERFLADGPLPKWSQVVFFGKRVILVVLPASGTAGVTCYTDGCWQELWRNIIAGEKKIEAGGAQDGWENQTVII